MIELHKGVMSKRSALKGTFDNTNYATGRRNELRNRNRLPSGVPWTVDCNPNFVIACGGGEE